MPEVEVRKDERLPDFVLVARLEDFAPLNQTAEPLAFLLDALLDQSPCDLAGRQRLFFLEKYVVEELEVLVRNREVVGPVLFGFSLVRQQGDSFNLLTGRECGA